MSKKFKIKKYNKLLTEADLQKVKEKDKPEEEKNDSGEVSDTAVDVKNEINGGEENKQSDIIKDEGSQPEAPKEEIVKSENSFSEKSSEYINNKFKALNSELVGALNNYDNINDVISASKAFRILCNIGDLEGVEAFLKKKYEYPEELLNDKHLSDEVKAKLKEVKAKEKEDNEGIVKELIDLGYKEDKEESAEEASNLFKKYSWLKPTLSLDVNGKHLNAIASAIENDNIPMMKLLASKFPGIDLDEKIGKSRRTPISFAETDSTKETARKIFGDPETQEDKTPPDMDNKELEKPKAKTSEPRSNRLRNKVRSIADKYNLFDANGNPKRDHEKVTNSLQRGLKLDNGDDSDIGIFDLQNLAAEMIKEGELDYPDEDNLKVSSMSKALNDFLRHIYKMLGVQKGKKGKAMNPDGLSSRELVFFNRLKNNCVLLPNGVIALKDRVKEQGKKDGLLKPSFWNTAVKPVNWAKEKLSGMKDTKETKDLLKNS